MAAERLILNRYSGVTAFNDENMEPALLVGACVRGRSTRYTLIDAKQEPVLFGELEPFARWDVEKYALLTPMFGDDNPLVDLDVEPKLRARFRKMGLLIDRKQMPKRVRYECPLGGKIPGLPAQPAVAGELANLIVHPGYSYHPEGRLSSALQRRVRSFPSDYSPPRVWLEDPGTRALSPFWPEEDFDEIARGLVPGETPKRLPPKAASALRRAGVLVERSFLTERRRLWSWLGGEGAEFLKKHGFVAVRRVLLPFQVGALRHYYRRMIEQGFMPFIDKRDARRFVTHNEPIARFYQSQLGQLMRRIVGRPLRVTHLALSAYQGGAFLPTHVDGADSDWNISLQIDFTPEPTGETPWPLLLGDESEPQTPVYLGLGDLVIYRGNALPHARPRLGRKQTSTTLIFHYGEPS